MMCPRPSSPSHGAVSPSGSAVACGESVQYTCDNGYTLVVSQTLMLVSYNLGTGIYDNTCIPCGSSRDQQ